MVRMFPGHSSGGNSWRKLRQAEIGTRSELLHFVAKRTENHFIAGSEYSANVCDAKTLTFHMEIANNGHGRQPKFATTLFNDI